jgi:hypothetical protein
MNVPSAMFLRYICDEQRYKYVYTTLIHRLSKGFDIDKTRREGKDFENGLRISRKPEDFLFELKFVQKDQITRNLRLIVSKGTLNFYN